MNLYGVKSQKITLNQVLQSLTDLQLNTGSLKKTVKKKTLDISCTQQLL